MIHGMNLELGRQIIRGQRNEAIANAKKDYEYWLDEYEKCVIRPQNTRMTTTLAVGLTPRR